jgi:N-acetylmuramoyl-L-alanine amidase
MIMRKLNRIILHCSATIERAHFDVDTIRMWHKKRKFKDIGYHYVIYLDGSIHIGRPVAQVGSHTRGHNQDSIGVCYVGGIGSDGKPKDTMTPAQDIGFIQLVKALRLTFGPHLSIRGHNEYSKKACPCFDVRDKYNFLLKSKP